MTLSKLVNIRQINDNHFEDVINVVVEIVVIRSYSFQIGFRCGQSKLI